jgi:drug/metabolite transporter (DMT)-like permease
MIYVILSIGCSVIVSVLLKLAKRYEISIYQVITWNYSIAIPFIWFFFKPQLGHLENAPVSIYLLLGLMLPLLFVIIAASIRSAGIVRTDVAQRLSLFIPLVAAFLLFNEPLTALKITGLVIGIIAVICCIPWHTQNKNQKVASNSWLYLVTVFAGMGFIDVLLKQVAAFNGIGFNTSLFIIYCLAFLVALTGFFILLATKKINFAWHHILFGWVLGLANFGNILFYIKAHQSLAKNPSVVFSGMNIGVIVLGTFIGLVIFKERLSLLNKAGIVLAIVAVVLITISLHAV